MTKLSQEELYKKFFKKDISTMSDMFQYALTPVIELFKYKPAPMQALFSSEENCYNSLALAMRSYIERNEKLFSCHFSILDYLVNDTKDLSIDYLNIRLNKNCFSFNSNILDFIFLQKNWDDLNSYDQNAICLFIHGSNLTDYYDGLDSIDLTLKNPTMNEISMAFKNYYPDGSNKIRQNSMDYFIPIFSQYEKDIQKFLSIKDKNFKNEQDDMLKNIASSFLSSCHNFWLKSEDNHEPIIDFFKSLNIENLNGYPLTQKLLAYHTPIPCFLKLYQNKLVDITLQDLAKINYYTVNKAVQQFCISEYGQYHPTISYLAVNENLFNKYPTQKQALMEALFIQCDDNYLLKSLTNNSMSYTEKDIPEFFEVREGDSRLDYTAQFLFDENKINSLSYLISIKPDLFNHIEKVNDSSSDYKYYSRLEKIYLEHKLNLNESDKKPRQKI